MKLEHDKGTKVTEPGFWKKILGVINGGKNILGLFFKLVAHIFESNHWNVLKFHIYNKFNIIYHLEKRYAQEKFGSDCIVGTRPYFFRLVHFGFLGVFIYSKKLYEEGLISIIIHSICVFLKKSLRDEAENSQEALLR